MIWYGFTPDERIGTRAAYVIKVLSGVQVVVMGVYIMMTQTYYMYCTESLAIYIYIFLEGDI